MSSAAEAPPPRRRGNGLLASNFVALADVDPRLGEHLLDLLRLADVPAYLEPSAADQGRTGGPRDRLYVAGAMRDEALAVVAAAADEAGGTVVRGEPGPSSSMRATDRPDPLAGIDLDEEFAALVADWTSDDPLPGDAFDLLDEGGANIPAGPVEDDLDDEHFEPPPPPPLPKLSATSVGAILLFALGIAIIGFASQLGLTSDLSFPFGVILILTGGGLLLSRLRDDEEDEDEEDDGAVL
ncbi:MAG: hypothetical protein ACR2KJ_08365 [Jatrophihabitans sp.]